MAETVKRFAPPGVIVTFEPATKVALEAAAEILNTFEDTGVTVTFAPARTVVVAAAIAKLLGEIGVIVRLVGLVLVIVAFDEAAAEIVNVFGEPGVTVTLGPAVKVAFEDAAAEIVNVLGAPGVTVTFGPAVNVAVEELPEPPELIAYRA